MLYDRHCTKCNTVIETNEKMLDSAPIPCVACDGAMVRASWLARPSMFCERADKSTSKPEPMNLPDGSVVTVRTEAEARAIEKNFDGLRIHASPKENFQDVKRAKAASQEQLKKEIHDMNSTVVTQMSKEGLL